MEGGGLLSPCFRSSPHQTHRALPDHGIPQLVSVRHLPQVQTIWRIVCAAGAFPQTWLLRIVGGPNNVAPAVAD